MLEFADVSFAYSGSAGQAPALRGVTFSLAPGETIAIVGANGSGKSTLAKLADGLFTPLSGSVLVDGMRTDDASRIYDVRSRVGIVFQHPDDQIVATSVEDDVAFGPENLGLAREEIRSRVDEALAAVGLWDLREREPHRLSGGQKQRVAIAGALAMAPAYLVLDEPTSMLDPAGRDEVLTVLDGLRHIGHGILLITHDLGEAARADMVLVLRSGRVAFRGSPADLLGYEDLSAAGLEMSDLQRLVAELRRGGVELPAIEADPVKIVGALCR